MAATFDYGKQSVAAFNEAARAGTLRYEQGAAEQAGRMYHDMADGLLELRAKMQQLPQSDGYGGFESGRQLQQGFGWKAAEAIRILDQLIEGALRLKEAYLRAGGMVEAADEANRAAIAHINEGLDGK
ncbi:hypothetical protein [Nocardia camponoti]|uniref:hypothetical protein n=1 Tax=Nocardia camponoti TaxID=1616106 RepID=UPI00166BF59F|nr:hypothetical protein [Nocardia camponoti]